MCLMRLESFGSIMFNKMVNDTIHATHTEIRSLHIGSHLNVDPSPIRYRTHKVLESLCMYANREPRLNEDACVHKN